MPIAIKDLQADVDRVEQSKAFYCAAACSQMVLAHYSIQVLQPQAFDIMHGMPVEPGQWQCDPLSIATYLGQQLQTKIDFVPTDFSGTDFQSGLNHLFYTLNQLSFPCISLVYAGAHWIVVDGMRYSEDNDGSRQFVGVWVQDPWFSEPPQRFIAIDEFQHTYFLPNKWGTRWKDKFVAISNNVATQLREVSISSLGRVLMSGGGGVQDAIGAGIAGLEQLGFKDSVPITAGGGNVSEISVQELDSGGEYKIVPLDSTRSEGLNDFVYVALRLNFANGAINSSDVLEIARISQALGSFNDEEMAAHLRTMFPNRTINILPGYFWKPCVELRSRFSVTREFELDGLKQFLLPNGSVVDQLHEFVQGA